MTREESKNEMYFAIDDDSYTSSDMIIDKIYDYFEKEKQQLIKGQNLLIKAHEGYIEDVMNRTCGNCICWDSVEFSVLKTMSYCRFLNVGTKNTFGCNEWESR